jgi:hypothetical protein
MNSSEWTEADAETVRRFRKRPWGEWTKNAAFVLFIGGPFLWARRFAPSDQGAVFMMLMTATLGLFATRTRNRFWKYSPGYRVIRRNVLCHLGRLDIEPETEPSDQHEGAFENARKKHPWAVALSALVLYYLFCAVYIRLAIKGTKQDIDVALVVLLVVHLIVRIGRKANQAHSQPSAR